MKQRLQKERGLLWQMIATMVATLIPLGIVISLLFARAGDAMQKSWDTNQQNNARIISGKLDDYVQGIYSTSDAFATDPRLLEKIDAIYPTHSKKLLAIQYIKNNLFVSYNLLQDNPQISIIYNTDTEQVFNLLDPNQNNGLVYMELQELKVDAAEKLGKFYWYPLQENFVQSEEYNDPRRDNIVLGSRRIFKPIAMKYEYVHLFAVQEEKIYELYEDVAQESLGEIYIVDAQNQLISSSEVQAVQNLAVPSYVQDWMDAQAKGKEPANTSYSFYTYSSAVNGWKTILVEPRSAIETQMQELYAQVLWVIVVAVVIAVGSIARLYYRFTSPLSKVAKAMHRVDDGDLQAYVTPSGGQQVYTMMETYNTMLESLNRNLDERLKLEQKKKELEMQVLMTQINPHFLYNTLETIVWRAGEAGRTDISRLAASLGKLYRLSISGGTTVPLRQELSHLQAYLRIQNSRYKDRIEYRQQVPPEFMDTTSLIKLSLQPIAENSILHAMSDEKQTIVLRVKAIKRGNNLIVWVTDTGIGMSREQLAQLRSKLANPEPPVPDAAVQRRSTGIGLWNIAERMKLYLGEGASFTVYSKQGWGTAVKMVIPQVPQKEQ